MSLVEVVVLGSIIGGIWALVASGFSLVFGVARILNFAHGTYFALGAYVAIVANAALQNVMPEWLSLIFSILFSIFVVGLAGVAIYHVCIRPVRDYEVMVILVTLAIALLFEEILLAIFRDVSVSVPSLVSGVVNVAGIPIPYTRILALVVAVVVILLLDRFISTTRTGKEILATSQDVEAAMLVGIDVERVYRIVMFISAMLAALAGVLYAQIYAVNPQTALRVLIYAFAIVILGGLGSVRGSIIAAFIIGFMQVAVSIALEARWSEIVAMVAIIAILIVRPKGLMGVE
ncbi:branched-chain amino acid ABC transporter permease [Archaeoglobus veneficus]|uniref:ABC-type transporter, integral membrane subunit n=1 Tax=Archaeoglobus veneficus (strain DSM 11195 / SNP6) TaxID=693661 RepID=F2KRS1_ARCVS|nr:branched-chain amino acid ABC transporter permease [Archaeoglobus veneficus]AEA47935.1 ABC-type transporter, integral membrane subunit [Archaeoglobus veneficus SNP6]